MGGGRNLGLAHLRWESMNFLQFLVLFNFSICLLLVFFFLLLENVGCIFAQMVRCQALITNINNLFITAYGPRHEDEDLLCLGVRQRPNQKWKAKKKKTKKNPNQQSYVIILTETGSPIVESRCAESLDIDANAEVEENVEEVKVDVTEKHHSPLEEKLREEEEEENEMAIQKKDENETPE
ncbi:hypothetical protein CJ030_MR2G005726 [Morella rubra]|uniref:Uncharacterized protein n=1 Tax=Morella rubra TaxID=262757 RepID=A0A6A1WG95_9ROSI|nr:hypothetical protein CJ030_MR2G005726 [Morella rubra]